MRWRGKILAWGGGGPHADQVGVGEGRDEEAQLGVLVLGDGRHQGGPCVDPALGVLDGRVVHVQPVVQTL